VDDPDSLRALMATLTAIGRDVRVVFPVHPRTKQRLQSLGLDAPGGGVHLTGPVGYIDFLALQKHAAVVVTDSGGVQEETTYLGVPCLTVRENTERPITCTVGTNALVGRDVRKLAAEVARILAGGAKKGGVPPGWDGKAGERIADVVTRGKR
jgi:UDP-N-acetylglucosamine 2-epimerase (non-hydrolysing)